MWRCYLNACGFGGVLLVVAVSSAADAAPVRIMPMGDDITEGVGSPGGYRDRLYDRLSQQFDVAFVGQLATNPADGMVSPNHEGHSGLTTFQLRSPIVSSLPIEQPDLVLLMVGTNDVSQHTVSQIRGQALKLFADIGGRGGLPRILVSFIPRSTIESRWADETAANNAIAAAVNDFIMNPNTPDAPILLVDVGAALNSPELYADGVLPNAAGYERLADAWYDAIIAAKPVGDMNLDFSVDVFDVAAVSNHWSENGPKGDANGDGLVDIFDVAVISNNWSTDGARAVPEPDALVFACLCLVAVAGARKATRSMFG